MLLSIGWLGLLPASGGLPARTPTGSTLGESGRGPSERFIAAVPPRSDGVHAAGGGRPAGAPPEVVASGQGGRVQATPSPSLNYTSVVLEWTTKSEVNTAGFNMFRAESNGGPFVQINRELIPSANDPIAGGHYVYTDTTAEEGRTYYYQLEDVELSGNRTRHDTITTTARGATLALGGLDAATLGFIALGALSLIMGLGFVLWRSQRQ